MLTIYGISNCDSVKKNKKQLEANQVDFTYHDFRKDGLSQDKLSLWLNTVDWQILLNKRGTSFRNLPDDIKNNLNQDNIAALLLENPTLIKRPVVEFKDKILVGLKPEQLLAEITAG